MWPSVTNKGADRALTAALVAALALAHLSALLLIDPNAPGKPAVQTRISMKTGQARSRPQEVPTPPRLAEPKAEEPREAIAPVPAPVAVPAASESAAEPAMLDATPAGDSVYGSAFGSAGDAVGDGDLAGRIDVTATIMRRLEERKVYPIAARRRGAEGDVVVRFTLRPDGTIASVAAESPDAHPLLRRAAVDSVVAAAPFPLPEGLADDMEFAVTIAYRLSD